MSITLVISRNLFKTHIVDNQLFEMRSEHLNNWIALLFDVVTALFVYIDEWFATGIEVDSRKNELIV